MRSAIILTMCASAVFGATAVKAQIELSRAAYVERLSDNGKIRSIEPATSLSRGDTVVLVVDWRSDGARKSFVVSSPIPKHLKFKSSSHDGQIVSIDNGRSWGRIGTLRVNDRFGSRRASVEDVTHLRWTIPSHQSANGSGKITYSAIVR